MTEEKKVLDIGAADNPDKRATDAIDDFVSNKEIKKAMAASPNLDEYYKGDIKHPDKEMKGKYDMVVAHFVPAMSDKATSKALDYVTKDNATAEIETSISDAPAILSVLHNAEFKVTEVKAKEIPSIVPALKIIGGNVVIKAHKVEGQKELPNYPVEIIVPCRHNKPSVKPHKPSKRKTSTNVLRVSR